MTGKSKWKLLCRVGQSHIRIFAHRTFLLFSKVRLCNRTFCRSSLKCDCAIALFVALPLKRANVRKCAKKVRIFKSHYKKRDRTIVLSKRAKMCEKSANFLITLFCSLKIAIAHFHFSFSFEQFAHSKICTFLHIFAHSLFSKVQLCDRTFLSLI